MTMKENKNKKRIAGFLVFLLLSCYLFATGAVAQMSQLTAGNTQIKYTPAHVSYGDVWEFDQATYDQANFSLPGSAELKWYTDETPVEHLDDSSEEFGENSLSSNFFVNVDTSKGVLSNYTTLEELAFTKFRSGIFRR